MQKAYAARACETPPGEPVRRVIKGHQYYLPCLPGEREVPAQYRGKAPGTRSTNTQGEGIPCESTESYCAGEEANPVSQECAGGKRASLISVERSHERGRACTICSWLCSDANEGALSEPRR